MELMGTTGPGGTARRSTTSQAGSGLWPARRLRANAGRLLALLALACLIAAATASAASAEEYEAERTAAKALGLKAYEYGQPLLDTERIYKAITSVTVADNFGDAPVNQFSHFQNLATEKEGCVVAPNADTLYSIAELRLRKKPEILYVPESEDGRFNVAELVSPYTENFADIGTGASGMLPHGAYVIAGPGQLVGQEETEGLKIIHSPYEKVWIIGRTLVNSPSDLPAARALNNAMKIVPLNKWAKYGLAYEPPAPKKIVTTPTCGVVPGTQAGEKPLKYYVALGKALQENPPPAADEPLLKELEAVNIGPGKAPSKHNVSRGTLAGLEEGVTSGPVHVQLLVKKQFEAGFAAHNGWLVGNIGHYGTDYALRAIADKLGVGALTPNVSIYPLALTDRTGGKLNAASTRYVAHFPASDFPVPVTSFWSISMYETNGFFVPNSLDRYTLGNRSNLQFNLDGSLDIYMQTSEPSNEAERENWLPAPAGPFQTVMRLYGTYESDIAGILEGGTEHWQPPTILPCNESGETAEGVRCAT